MKSEYSHLILIFRIFISIFIFSSIQFYFKSIFGVFSWPRGFRMKTMSSPCVPSSTNFYNQQEAGLKFPSLHPTPSSSKVVSHACEHELTGHWENNVLKIILQTPQFLTTPFCCRSVRAGPFHTTYFSFSSHVLQIFSWFGVDFFFFFLNGN